ncbi:MAG TPA: glycosyltransferase [Candidatus Limnocylindrales bacterium]|nr:glycosyltransferase [Candidatus Limnocylindrales bacterium]
MSTGPTTRAIQSARRRARTRKRPAWASRPTVSVTRRPAVVANGPLRIAGPDDAAHERRFHERLGLPSEARVVLFLGQIAPERGLEQLCEAIGAVERAVLVLAGPGPDRARLERFAARLPWADRIRFLGPIPPPEIPAWTAAADVAAVLARPTTLNHRLATPTKLFDALGAGVPVVAANLPGIASIVGPSGCGILCDPGDPADIARAIRAILDAPPERRASFRAAALATAEAFAWERQLDRLLAVYDGLDIRPGGTVAAPQPTVGARAGRHAVERAGRPSEADAETRPPNGR